MAKVTGPLQSFSASGKIADSIVFFPWLGRNVVREHVIPQNPKTKDQGSTRLFIGAMGRAVSAVVKGSQYRLDLESVVPSGQTWVSAFVNDLSALYGADDSGVSGLTSDVSASTATNWDSSAEGAGLGDLTIAYAGTNDTLSAGAMLYALAKHAFRVKAQNPSLFSRTPYTTDLSSWSDTDVTDFVSDLQTVA